MNNIILIAAIGRNNELGKDNNLIWYLPNDLKFFKEQTINKHIVMGINTFKSLPKILDNRKHIVLTHQNVNLGDDVIVFNDKDLLLEYIKNINDDVFIIGGSQIYKQFIDAADRLLLTEINSEEKKADVFFPSFDKSDWICQELNSYNDNEIEYKHLLYERKKR